MFMDYDRKKWFVHIKLYRKIMIKIQELRIPNTNLVTHRKTDYFKI